MKAWPGPFRPAWWCRNAHLQTLLPQLARPLLAPPYRREVLDLPDGDFLDLDWLGDGASGSLAILVHGLGGSSRSPYIRGLADRLHRDGHAVCAMNLRGAGGRANRRPRTYHSGHTEDFDHLLRQLATRHPSARLSAVGFSLGGNMLLRWLGQNPSTNLLARACAVSTPFLLGRAGEYMNRGLSRLYRDHLVAGLKRSVTARAALLAGRIDRDAARNARTFDEFDDAVTAPVAGYRDSAEYYERCSSRQYLASITVPTLLIHARDDPFMDSGVLPGEHELGPGVRLEVSEGGGHVGFIAGGVPGRPKFWLEQRIGSLLGELLPEP